MSKFTDEELKLISRALNNHAVAMGNRGEAEESVNASKLATRIYRENFRIGMANEKQGHSLTELYGMYAVMPEDTDGVVIDGEEDSILCHLCGCVVGNGRQHLVWHDSL